jgi:NAD(P)-dependent dehydrogenase (short-subunit alcohol dehydrogenase family)
MTVQDRVIVVTGAGSGIGRALAVGFARDGAQVVGFDRDAAGLGTTAAGCDGRLLALAGDVTSDDDVRRLVRETEDRFGRIDALVNNAGIANMGTLLDRPFADWVAVIEVNLIGLARCTHAVLPGMLKRGHGRIVNVASRSAESPAPAMSAYSATKAGVLSFTKAVAREIAQAGATDVLVNALIPGPTDTPIWGRARPELRPPEAVYPHARFVVELPAGGPTGRVFFDSKDYRVYERFNE